VAELHSVPTPWDGSTDDLASGWDEAFLRAFESGREPDVLCAPAISARPDQQGRRLSSRMLNEMRQSAAAAGLRELIAPVRPTRKAEYPLVPIERYMAWRRPDGTHFDPWIRVHEVIGGEIFAAAPESMVMEAPVSDWEEWTGMQFPDDGEHVVPGMLAPLHVRDGVGRHVEPNIWVRHSVRDGFAAVQRATAAGIGTATPAAPSSEETASYPERSRSSKPSRARRTRSRDKAIEVASMCVPDG
jgi:hypothetical protein